MDCYIIIRRLERYSLYFLRALYRDGPLSAWVLPLAAVSNHLLSEWTTQELPDCTGKQCWTCCDVDNLHYMKCLHNMFYAIRKRPGLQRRVTRTSNSTSDQNPGMNWAFDCNAVNFSNRPVQSEHSDFVNNTSCTALHLNRLLGKRSLLLCS